MNLPCPAARAVPRLPVGSEARASAGTHASAACDASRWGWRLGRQKRFGAIFRSGEALEVTRGDGRRFVVTADAAAEAPALLTAITDRAHR